MNSLTYTIFNLSFIIVFAMLGIFTIPFHIPNDDKFRNYRTGRTTLSIGFFIIAVYCVIRILVPQHHDDYEDTFMKMLFSFVFSWLNYASFLYFIEDRKYEIRQFFVDGMVPTVIMTVTGIAGIFIPSAQDTIIVLFGVLFGIKCSWMCYVCLREYNRCVKDLDNYYGESPDIRWIYGLIWLTFILSISTIVAIYCPSIHLVYDIAAPAIFVYMVCKIVSFIPNKIVSARSSGADSPAAEQKEPKNDMSGKMKDKVDRWVSDKGFCKADINIKDVSREMGTNHTYLSTYLNSNLNQTFSVWLNTLRIEESKHILTDGQKKSIEEIGVMVGFQQSYNFSRWFKIVTGTTPFKWRKDHISQVS